MWPCPLAVPRGISDGLHSRGKDLSASTEMSKQDALGALRILLLGGPRMFPLSRASPVHLLALRQFGARLLNLLAVDFHARELFLVLFLEAGWWHEAFYGA